MKMAKTHKIIILTVALVLSLVFALAFMNVKKADAAVEAQNYLVYEDVASSNDTGFDEANDYIWANLYNGAKVSIKNEVASNDLSIKFQVPEHAKELTVTLTTSSYDVNGNKNVEGKFDKEIDHEIKIDLVNNKANFRDNEIAIALTDNWVELSSTGSYGNELTIGINGQNFAPSANAYYKIGDMDKIATTVSFEATFDSDSEVEKLNIEYVDQKASATSNDDYKQEFAIENGGFAKSTLPRVNVSDDFFAFDKDGNHVVEIGRKYTLNLKGLGFQDNFASSSYSIDGTGFVINEKTIAFDTEGTFTIQIKHSNKVVETYTVKAVDEDKDAIAPKYNLEDSAIESFKEELNNLIYNADGTSKLTIGNNSYLTLNLNMFKSMVRDDLTSFENLEYKLYYMSETKNTSTSSLRIPLTEAGHYRFYVSFIDDAGNEMEGNNFYYYDAEDNLKKGDYGKYVFEFDVEDVSSLSISASKPGTGYVGTKYNASSFTVDASFTYTDTYKLFYAESYDAENPDATEWKEITASAAATDMEADYQGYTYDEIKTIAYDGKLSFVPDKTGFYKIEVSVTSSESTKSDSESMIIEVKDVVKTVKVDNKWLKNNVWSVVFLSCGTVCLAFIIVLLFIKPKDDDEDVDFDRLIKK